MFKRLLLKLKYKMPLEIFLNIEFQIFRKKIWQYQKMKQEYPIATFRFWRIWCKMFDEQLLKSIESQIIKAGG